MIPRWSIVVQPTGGGSSNAMPAATQVSVGNNQFRGEIKDLTECDDGWWRTAAPQASGIEANLADRSGIEATNRGGVEEVEVEANHLDPDQLDPEEAYVNRERSDDSKSEYAQNVDEYLAGLEESSTDSEFGDDGSSSRDEETVASDEGNNSDVGEVQPTQFEDFLN